KRFYSIKMTYLESAQETTSNDFESQRVVNYKDLCNTTADRSLETLTKKQKYEEQGDDNNKQKDNDSDNDEMATTATLDDDFF
ncbi:unnamed protein product, partial [Didymodactylos carnosus]